MRWGHRGRADPQQWWQCIAVNLRGTPVAARTERMVSTAVLGFAVSEAAGRFRGYDQAVIDADFAELQQWLRRLLPGTASQKPRRDQAANGALRIKRRGHPFASCRPAEGCLGLRPRGAATDFVRHARVTCKGASDEAANLGLGRRRSRRAVTQVGVRTPARPEVGASMRGSAGSPASTATSSSGLSALTPSDRRQCSWELAPRLWRSQPPAEACSSPGTASTSAPLTLTGSRTDRPVSPWGRWSDWLFPHLRNGRPWRPKDIHDIAMLRGLAAEADTQPDDLAASDGRGPLRPAAR